MAQYDDWSLYMAAVQVHSDGSTTLAALCIPRLIYMRYLYVDFVCNKSIYDDVYLYGAATATVLR